MAAGGATSPLRVGKLRSVAGIETTQLALFLVLLAFFFALVAGAEFDDKRRGDVVSSVRDAFPASVAGDKARIVGSERPEGPVGEALSALHKRLREMFPSAQESRRSGDNSFLLDMPVAAVLRPTGELRSKRITQAGSAIAKAGLPGLDVLMIFPERTSLAPVGASAQMLVDAGVAQSALSIGLDPAISDRVQLRISADLGADAGSERAR